MTGSLLAGLVFVAMLRVATADTLTGYLSYAQSPSNGFVADIKLSDIGDPECAAVRNIPFPTALSSDSKNCDIDAEPTGELFYLSVIVLPKPSEDKFLMPSPAASTTPQERPGAWLLISIATAIALIGGTRVLRVRRTSENRA